MAVPANDNDRLAALEAEIAHLRAERQHDTETRQALLAASAAALPALAARQERWEQILASSRHQMENSPALEQLRSEGLLPQLAIIKTRLRALEETCLEGLNLIMSRQSELEETLAAMKALIKERLGGA